MESWSYMTVKEYKELERLAKKYKLPCPSQIQTVKIEKEEEDVGT